MQWLKCIHGTDDVVDFGNLEACQGIPDQQVNKTAIIDNQDPEILQINASPTYTFPGKWALPRSRERATMRQQRGRVRGTFVPSTPLYTRLVAALGLYHEDPIDPGAVILKDRKSVV